MTTMQAALSLSQAKLPVRKSFKLPTSRSCTNRVHTRLSRAGGNGVITAELQEGDKVKVKSSIIVYHVGKFKEGIDLEGMEGVVVGNASLYQGQVLSANLPWKVEFVKDVPDGKPAKFIVHLEEDEVDAL